MTTVSIVQPMVCSEVKNYLCMVKAQLHLIGISYNGDSLRGADGRKFVMNTMSHPASSKMTTTIIRIFGGQYKHIGTKGEGDWQMLLAYELLVKGNESISSPILNRSPQIAFLEDGWAFLYRGKLHDCLTGMTKALRKGTLSSMSIATFPEPVQNALVKAYCTLEDMYNSDAHSFIWEHD